MRILAVGDLVGENGVKKLKETLPEIRKEKNIDFVIVNAENSASGMGCDMSIDRSKDQRSVSSPLLISRIVETSGRV